jgi:molybdenum-dependent DNA-binding transcriptional regulator ModE
MLLLDIYLICKQIGPNSTAAAARKTGVSYKDAGVDIDAGNALVEVCVLHTYVLLISMFV